MDLSNTQKCVSDSTMAESPSDEFTPIIARLVSLTKFPTVELIKMKTSYRFGRDESNDIVLCTTLVSKRHCILSIDSETLSSGKVIYKYHLVDVGSTNGTYVNGMKLNPHTPRVLKNGDMISLALSLSGQQSTGSGFCVYRFDDLSAFEEDMLIDSGIRDKYELLEVLGQGQFGLVRKVVSRKTGVELALKIIDKTKFNLAAQLDRKQMVEEMSLLYSIKHPYTIRMVDHAEDNHYFYILMELIKGGDLLDRLQNKGFYQESEARQLFFNLLSALSYLHSKNIVHRDLKPENIMLASADDDVTIKITDFGLAKAVGTEGLKTICGTPLYFAPEILSSGKYGKAVDMWSSGVILYALMCGRLPFSRCDETGKPIYVVTFMEPQWGSISRVCDMVADLQNEMNMEAKDLVQRLLNCNPERRYTADQALQHKWFSGRSIDDALHLFSQATESQVIASACKLLPTQQSIPSTPPCMTESVELVEESVASTSESPCFDSLVDLTSPVTSSSPPAIRIKRLFRDDHESEYNLSPKRLKKDTGEYPQINSQVKKQITIDEMFKKSAPCPLDTTSDPACPT